MTQKYPYLRTQSLLRDSFLFKDLILTPKCNPFSRTQSLLQDWILTPGLNFYSSTESLLQYKFLNELNPNSSTQSFPQNSILTQLKKLGYVVVWETIANPYLRTQSLLQDSFSFKDLILTLNCNPFSRTQSLLQDLI